MVLDFSSSPKNSIAKHRTEFSLSADGVSYRFITGKTFGFNLIRTMKKCMIAITEKFKIFNSVIMLNPVFVMHHFPFHQISANIFRYYESMFQNITISICVWMVSFFYKHITLRIESFPSLPHRIVRTGIIRNSLSEMSSSRVPLGMAFQLSSIFQTYLFVLSFCQKRFVSFLKVIWL